MKPKALITISLCLVALAALPAAASGSARQLAVFEDSRQLLQRGDAVRDRTLDELRALGVDVIRFQLTWAGAAPGGKRKPAGFDGRDPAQYPGWGRFDGLVSAARARGFQVMAVLGPPAPNWATRGSGRRAGVARPKAGEYARFVEAAGRRYPSINIWSFWNEPNHPGFLYPQATRKRVPFSPRLYRGLVRAGVAGLRRSGNGGDRILFGELLPIGKSRIFRNNTMKPIRFMREFFCLNGRWRPYRGRAARVRGCRGYRRLTGLRGFAYHPYTRPGGPRSNSGTRQDATIRTIGRVFRALDRARKRRRIGGRRLSVWNTEFGYQSNPPDPFLGAKIGRIPAFINESEWMSFRKRRLASYSQYTLIDDPLGDRSDRYGTWQGGLRFASGRAKRRVYNAYRSPLFVRLLGPRGVAVWGAARAGGPGTRVQVQQRLGRRAWRNLGPPIRVRNARGYFTQRYRLARASRRSFRFRYSSGATTFGSRSAKAVFR